MDTCIIIIEDVNLEFQHTTAIYLFMFYILFVLLLSIVLLFLKYAKNEKQERVSKLEEEEEQRMFNSANQKKVCEVMS